MERNVIQLTGQDGTALTITTDNTTMHQKQVIASSASLHEQLSAMRGLAKMRSLNDPVKRSGNWQYLAKFLSVGMVGTLVDLTLYTALHVILGAPALAANTLSYSAGIVNNYLLHRRWTYADRVPKAVGAQFSQFAVVSLSALILNNLLVLVLARPLGTLLAHPGSGDLLAKLCATGVGVCWNFVINSNWTFRAVTKRVER